MNSAQSTFCICKDVVRLVRINNVLIALINADLTAFVSLHYQNARTSRDFQRPQPLELDYRLRSEHCRCLRDR